MNAANLDRLLALLVVAMVATGVATLRVGTAGGTWLVVLHGLLAGALATAVVAKLWHSVPRAVAGRRWRPLALATVLSGLVVGALGLGWLWAVSAGHPNVRGFTILVLHAWLGLVLLPLLIVHLLPRRWRVLRLPPRRQGAGPLLTRRAMLIGGGLALAGLSTYVVSSLLARFSGDPRRFTGSRFLPDGGLPPPTTFLGEPVPDLDAASWRLAVRGLVDRPLTLTLGELEGLGLESDDPILDCTSGWALRTSWRGVPLERILDAAGVLAGARQVVVRAVSGWTAEFPLDEARGCMLATAVADRPLPLGNGAPCRLVAPLRRGLDWVKWVAEVEVA
jgi:hypothetical protein